MQSVSSKTHDTTLETGDGEHVTEEDACRVGNQYGRYRLEHRLGVGGMGEVFAARHVDTGEPVAFKTLSRTHATQRYRFKREFRALADVEHPNLVRLRELVVPTSGPSYFTMELLDGEAFTSWVRAETPAGELPDLPRLEAAFLQLLEGIECLHANQFVHRDLKPSNVMITRAGRVVILDFGIIAEQHETDRGVTRDGQVLGTPIYMAPEQASGDRADSAADLYALGVMLYECLTGEVPFSGTALRMLSEKQDGPTPDPASVVPTVPRRLRDLCMRLLDRDPDRRPTAQALLAQFGARTSSRLRAAGSTGSTFVGRQRELEQLRAALGQVREQRQALTVQVRGPSGQGKSALVREFVAEAQREADLLVLRGRCRERETVPYKGVDAVVDALGVHLRQLDEPKLAELRPKYVGALEQVFPVLAEIWPTDELERAHHDPHEARSLGWAALRELLSLLGRRHVLVIAIDDFQWADRDSAAILRALTRGPDGPTMLLLITARDELVDGELLAWLDDDDPALRLDVGPLPESAARELAMVLLRTHGDPPTEPGPLRSRAEALALRSGGSPFFIAQMVLGGDAAGSSEDVDQILLRRLAGLEPEARGLLEVVAVSGGPLSRSLALALSPGATSEHVDGLVALGMLVRGEVESSPQIEVAHDRIRELTLASVEPAACRAMHWAIGEQLLAHAGPEPSGDDVFAIADHFEAGLADMNSLSEAHRLELAQLQRRAGERARAAAAWISARRYFALGHRLIEPWLAQARRGEGPRELCLAIAAGRVQAEAMAGSAEADAAYEELLSWSLSPVELGQIVAQRVAILRCTDRMPEAIDVGHVGLARLGWGMPRHPSLIRALLTMMLGWRTLGRLDVDALRALPEIDDERVRVRLDVLSEVAVSVFLDDPPSAILIGGKLARAIHRHGRHDSMVSVLVLVAVILCLLGGAREATSLCDRALQFSRSSAHAPLDVLRARVLSFLVLPATRPIVDLTAEVESLHRECCDCDLQESAGFLAVLGASLYVMTDMRLAAVSAAIDRFEARNPGLGSPFSRRLLELIRRYVQALIEGDSWEPETMQTVMVRYSDLSYRLGLAVQAGDYERARTLEDQMPRDYERVMMGSVAIPNRAMWGAILEAQRWPLPRGGERRRSLRVLRRHAKTLQRWAKRGPDTFGPIADIVEAEIATTRGDYEQAMAGYERARAKAGANRSLYVVGVACVRLARLAHRRGHTLMAESAFAAALDNYEAWGAKALASQLRERGLAGL
jgi:tRNA A-37 threonylcarbamoyl transferase component Bud32